MASRGDSKLAKGLMVEAIITTISRFVGRKNCASGSLEDRILFPVTFSEPPSIDE